MNEIEGWFAGRLPDDWFEGAAEVTVDRDEIVVVGTLAAPKADQDDKESDGDGARAAESGRIKRWREDTRAQRMRVADEAQRRFGGKVAWGATCGETRELFTNLSVPVMTRLRQPERRVLDTLVDAGVARSRSEALAWCVRLVGSHEDDWIGRLRDAVATVHEVRDDGPSSGA
jgi:Arc/MetJ-type ribon-helix-helix transcriptional regulator